ncbi:hypothetical protein GCM10010978_15090 [Compostibacillus humi]|uniref:Uncharacterized protein n=1 Tax=Compostibacillus humi TaxID=1245525 RepID=A0A8J2ZSS5_9BACI|nr:hypothetical protein [Compostibacillus humi]GGH75326.1 hypothetical protein GCM10010978_15090 [Compostibacillus humi]HLT56829.1 hypothetical protein [Bacillota bacterium]
METNKNITTHSEHEESYKGALFSTLVFVGGTIVLFIIILLALFIARI